MGRLCFYSTRYDWPGSSTIGCESVSLLMRFAHAPASWSISDHVL